MHNFSMNFSSIFDIHFLCNIDIFYRYALLLQQKRRAQGPPSNQFCVSLRQAAASSRRVLQEIIGTTDAMD